MLATFALTPPGAKRLIARGILKTPELMLALEKGRVIISIGTTNAYIAEELGFLPTPDKAHFAAGIVTGGLPCVTPPDTRLSHLCLERGQVVDTPWEEFLNGFGRDDVFIKGANAIDSTGAAAVLLANPSGGTFGQAFGTLAARGSRLLIPVGHEKMIPSCRAAVDLMGINRLDDSLGLRCGLAMMPFGRVFTEIDALQSLFGIQATIVAAGGTGGSEGAVVIAARGADRPVEDALAMARSLLKEKTVPVARQNCTMCFMSSPCIMQSKQRLRSQKI